MAYEYLFPPPTIYIYPQYTYRMAMNTESVEQLVLNKHFVNYFAFILLCFIYIFLNFVKKLCIFNRKKKELYLEYGLHLY